MLDLTQGSVSEKLNVVGQTESLHLRSRALVNHRVLNLQDTHQTQMKTQWHESLLVVGWGWRCYLVARDTDASVGDLLHPLRVKVSEGKFSCREKTIET